MKILDLTNLANSDVKYRIDKFPDGQNNLCILSTTDPTYPIGNGYIVSQLQKFTITIQTRLNNWLDLELLCCAVASLRQCGVKEIHLYCPIIIGSRSDRKFEDGGNNYLKQVICPIINSLNFESVTSYDTHSTCSEMGFSNFQNTSNLSLVKFALNNIYNLNDKYLDCRLIAPDAGSLHKIYKLAEQINYQEDIITCTKERDTEGKLTKTVVPDFIGNHDFDKDMIIIDDICDGGRTFINIAKTIREKQKDCDLYLIVSHLLHEVPNPEIFEYFDMVYTTNSRHDKYYEKMKDYTKEHSKVKVLNIF